VKQTRQAVELGTLIDCCFFGALQIPLLSISPLFYRITAILQSAPPLLHPRSVNIVVSLEVLILKNS
jgi:hypothetical protein